MYLRKQFLFILPVINLEVMTIYSKPFAPKLCQRLRRYKNCPHFMLAAEKISCPVFGRKTFKTSKFMKAREPTSTSSNISPEKVTVVHHMTKLRPPKGYKKIVVGEETVYLKHYKVRRTWDGAQAVCQMDNGSLVKIKNREKGILLRKLLGRFESVNVWIGLKDLWFNDTYVWIDGTPLNYTNWEAREPHHGTENCAKLMNYLIVWYWYDNNCSIRWPFVCEV